MESVFDDRLTIQLEEEFRLDFSSSLEEENRIYKGILRVRMWGLIKSMIYKMYNVQSICIFVAGRWAAISI